MPSFAQRAKDEAIYQQVVGLTRFFFSELTSQTGGWMLDLSDPQLLESVSTAARNAVSNFIEIEPITRAELEEVRALGYDAAGGDRPQRACVWPSCRTLSWKK
ncbi:MAG: hypothetical protein R3C56_16790 [Pirellulaceae bacterium]